MQDLAIISKMKEWSLFIPKQSIHCHSNPGQCSNEQCWRSWSWTLLWRPTRPSRSNTKKRHPFYHRGLEYKSRKSRDSWSNRQVWPWSTKWSGAKANRMLPRQRTGHSKHPISSHKRQHYTRRTSPDGQHQNQIDYILYSQRWRSSIQSAKTRPGADCGSYHEHLIAKCRPKWKKVGKTTRPFTYDLNQITYNYTVEVTNRFKWLDLIDRVPEELWTEVADIVQEAVFNTTPKKKKCKKAKLLSEEPYK